MTKFEHVGRYKLPQKDAVAKGVIKVPLADEVVGYTKRTDTFVRKTSIGHQ